MSSPFGRQLRTWRTTRRLSQLDLALRAEVTPRHLSFLETGRSRPREGMVLRLADALDVPLREQNALLRAAGFDPLFPEADLDDARLAPVREVIAQLLARHAPFPALVMDAQWRVVDANPVGRALALAGHDLPCSAFDVLAGPTCRAMIDNWGEVAWASVVRARQDLAARPDAALAARVAAFEAAVLADGPAPPASSDPVVTTVLRVGDARVRTLTTICRFSSPRAVAADELQVELVFPADAESRAVLEAVGAAVQATGSGGGGREPV